MKCYKGPQNQMKLLNNQCSDWRIIKEYDHYQVCAKVLPNILLSRLMPYIGEIIGIISTNFHIINELLIRYSTVGR
jgi:hypothetical protein